MKKNIYIILIIFFLAACAKPVVDTKKEAGNVREIVSKIAGKKISTPAPVKVVLVQKESTEKESDFSLLEPSNFVYSYQNRKDPFYSLMIGRLKLKAELEEKKKMEEENQKRAELGKNMEQEQWEKIEVAAILGDGKGFLVLFGGDDTIYQKDDYIDKDKRIRIANINRNSVVLKMLKGGSELEKQILMKVESK